jgi:hypothetical protein
MTIRKTVPLLLVVAAGGVSSPVLADCCSGLLSCAATVVTYGVSCEIQTLIDTLNGIANLLTTFIHDATGQTQAAERQARQSVTDTINAMQSQSQQSASDLAAALSQAQVVSKNESTIREIKETTIVNQNAPTASSTKDSAPATGSAPLSVQSQSHLASNVNAKAGSGAPLAMKTEANQSLALAAAPSNTNLQKSTVLAGTQISASGQTTTTPYGTFNDAFSRAVKQIALLKNAGDTDLTKVNQYLAQAQNSEGPGVAQADTISGLMMSPLTAVQSEIGSMLSHPLSAFDPTSVVDSIENTVTADMSANVSKMIDDITTGPDQAFTAAQPTYDDLLVNAESAQAISDAMAILYQQRSTAAATFLYSLLPKVEFTGVDSKATAPGHVATQTNLDTRVGQRLSFATVSARLATAKKSALLAYKKPNTSQLQSAIAQFKAQRATGKSPLPQSTLAGYQSNLTQQLNGYFNGKSTAAIASQRDQLIAQARTQYAKDPTTENGIIALLNSEAAKRGTTTNSVAGNPAVPGQPVPKLTAPAAIATQGTKAAPSAALAIPRQPVAVAAPVNPPVNQAKTPTWGAAPSAWTPPAATSPVATAGRPAMATAAPSTMGAATSFKPATTQTTVQPVQQYQTIQQQPAIQSVPSSLGH